MMLKSVPRDQWGEVRVKSSAIEGLSGRKKQYGLNRRWYGDYLADVSFFVIILEVILISRENIKSYTFLYHIDIYFFKIQENIAEVR